MLQIHLLVIHSTLQWRWAAVARQWTEQLWKRVGFLNDSLMNDTNECTPVTNDNNWYKTREWSQAVNFVFSQCFTSFWDLFYKLCWWFATSRAYNIDDGWMDVWMDGCLSASVFNSLLLQFSSDSYKSWNVCCMSPYGETVEQSFKILSEFFESRLTLSSSVNNLMSHTSSGGSLGQQASV